MSGGGADRLAGARASRASWVTLKSLAFILRAIESLWKIWNWEGSCCDDTKDHGGCCVQGNWRGQVWTQEDQLERRSPQ